MKALPNIDEACIQLRRSFERFVELPDEVWSDLRRPWQLRPVQRGHFLTREGDTERTFLLVVEGVQRVFFQNRAGDEITVAFMYPYDYSGVPDSFLLQTPSMYTIEALTDGSVLSIDYDTLMILMDQYRELERWAWRLLAAAGAGRGKRERELLTLTARERYHRLLEEAPHIIQLVPQKHLASYLGMTPETLSRIRSDLS